ncbi:hypothetical protein HBI56_194690 [Parastagonospora nodorum]|uniref:Uncharacterized protein n=1 Tax=Phaeosphaeria nodorum (strain SN15 / ATCC MYA-4574 / FGSC 10173) TaxID=321614 RepID=A0A7U2EX25_PHANO|nr:hypothetical protein HBH56_206360 [Parastagonospora nodorum]QRC94706.1 hypothetical protein JI435_406230 [Parastagonospora nodorum SN15]KAH3923854.1 hypothetical protein HBH54_205230 [Parastagonospora nodorum]KAH3942331.1 hypothetical protein HBH53_189140 [Parastagonospora nodorum]KAH3962335.1 hypothetical protein HBH51_176650 [Parastagonospora nodorum]
MYRLANVPHHCVSLLESMCASDVNGLSYLKRTLHEKAATRNLLKTEANISCHGRNVDQKLEKGTDTPQYPQVQRRPAL